MFYVPQVLVDTNTNEVVWYLGLKGGTTSVQMNLNGEIVKSHMMGLRPLLTKDDKYYPGKENGLYGHYGFFDYARNVERRSYHNNYIAELKEANQQYRRGNLKVKGV